MQNPLNKLRMIVWLATLVVGCGELGQVDPGSALQVDALDVADAADPEMETLRSSTCEKHALGDDPYEDNDSMSAAWTGGMVANWENESLCEGYGCAVQGSDDDWYRIYVDQEHVTVSYENHYDGGAMSLEVYNNEGSSRLDNRSGHRDRSGPRSCLSLCQSTR